LVNGRVPEIVDGGGPGGLSPVPPRSGSGSWTSGNRPLTSGNRPLVVDLTALWAGPLATSFLVAAGCRVVKVEDPGRPDTTRTGPHEFFDLLNGGKQSVSVPFVRGGALAELIARADVVVESSRPRALEQLGIGPTPRQLWVSITGYGRSGPWRQWSALGDDAAAAGGLVVRRHPDGPPMFCGDAAADPVTGLHAAVAALAAIVGGFRGTIDLAMREVVGHAVGLPAGWCDRSTEGVGFSDLVVAPPRARSARVPGPALGHDNVAVFGPR
jgi:hypothetical protein